MVAVARVRPAALSVCLVLAASLASAETPPPSGPLEKGYVEGNLGLHIARARTIALKKLRSASCRRLFSEFKDLAGHPLEDRLSSRGETSERHLWSLNFRDGSNDPLCRRRGVFAFTSPGSSTIYICSSFRKLVQEETRDAANILIHEQLHALGAGEAPMPGLLTAQQITARVEDCCGW